MRHHASTAMRWFARTRRQAKPQGGVCAMTREYSVSGPPAVGAPAFRRRIRKKRYWWSRLRGGLSMASPDQVPDKIGCLIAWDNMDEDSWRTWQVMPADDGRVTRQRHIISTRNARWLSWDVQNNNDHHLRAFSKRSLAQTLQCCAQKRGHARCHGKP